MKWLVAYVAVVLALAGTLAFGQLSSTGVGKKASVGVTFSGPGDIVSGATAWYGLRAYSAADKGNRLLNVCNVADVACADLSSDATTGALVISTIGGSSCSVVACTIKTMYDRSGSGLDVTNTTIAQRPVLTLNCINTTLPCATFSGGQGLSVTFTALSQPITISTVAVRTSTTVENDVYSSGGGGGSVSAFFSGANLWGGYAGSTPTKAATDGNWHSLLNVYNGASGVINVNGSSSTANWGANTIPNATASIGSFGPGAGSGRNLNGKITEVGLWPSGFSAGDQTSMCHNQYTYWGTSVSC